MFNKSIKDRIEKVQYRASREKQHCVKRLVRQIYQKWNEEINNKYSGDGFLFYVPRKLKGHWWEIGNVHWCSETVVCAAMDEVKKKHPGLIMYDLTADWIKLDYSKCLDDII